MFCLLYNKGWLNGDIFFEKNGETLKKINLREKLFTIMLHKLNFTCMHAILSSVCKKKSKILLLLLKVLIKLNTCFSQKKSTKYKDFFAFLIWVKNMAKCFPVMHVMSLNTIDYTLLLCITLIAEYIEKKYEKNTPWVFLLLFSCSCNSSAT